MIQRSVLYRLDGENLMSSCHIPTKSGRAIARLCGFHGAMRLGTAARSGEARRGRSQTRPYEAHHEDRSARRMMPATALTGYLTTSGRLWRADPWNGGCDPRRVGGIRVARAAALGAARPSGPCARGGDRDLGWGADDDGDGCTQDDVHTIGDRHARGVDAIARVGPTRYLGSPAPRYRCSRASHPVPP